MRVRNLHLLLIAVLMGLLLGRPGMAQDGNDRGNTPSPSIDQVTARILNDAIELMNADRFDEVRETLGKLKLDRLSPYERGRVEQILASVAFDQQDFATARQHLQNALDSGGLNTQEISQTRYQLAQMLLADENWEAGAEALEAWLATATSPNSSAHYLLAAAYYQLDRSELALQNARKAVELSDKPQESWLQLLIALLFQDELFPEATDVLANAVNLYPDKKNYWLQLSSVHAAQEDYAKALAVMEMAQLAGLLTEGGDFRRLSELMMAQDNPYRAARVLEEAMDGGLLEADEKSLTSLANAWIAAREFSRAIPVLARAGALAEDGTLFVRLGEVNMQLNQWDAAVNAFLDALDKGEPDNQESVFLLTGISYFNLGQWDEAKSWLSRAAQAPAQKSMASAYLQLMDSRMQAAVEAP